jgi:small-conductance mechanosensitive channel
VLVGLQVANVALLAVLAMQVVDFAAAVIRSRDHANAALRSLDDLLVVSLARIGKIVLVAVAIVWVVSILGAESSVNRLLAGLGIGGIAFALALQEPLRNFFSSLVLAADRPFGVGDEVTLDGVKGKVEHVGFRTTTLRTRTRTRLVVPNATVVSAKLEASEAGALKEFKAVLPLAFEADASALDGLRARASELLHGAPGVQPGTVEVGITALGTNGIEFTATALFAKGSRPLWQVFDGLHGQLLAAARGLGLPLRAAPAR